MVATNIDEPLLLAKNGILFFCPKILADSGYLCSSDGMGENQTYTYQKLNYKQTLYFLRRLKKSRPAMHDNCVTVYFPIEMEDITFRYKHFNYYREVHSTAEGDHLFGAVDESKEFFRN